VEEPDYYRNPERKSREKEKFTQGRRQDIHELRTALTHRLHPTNRSNAMTGGATKKELGTNPGGSPLDKLKEWVPKGAEWLLRVGTNPWASSVLPRKEVELISLALALCVHEPQRVRHAPPYPCRARCGRNARRGSPRLQTWGRSGDPYVQPRRTHSSQRNEGRVSESQRRPEAGDPGVRRDAGDRMVEHRVGLFLRTFPAKDRRLLRPGGEDLQERKLGAEGSGS
jgi:hypothetical protein